MPNKLAAILNSDYRPFKVVQTRCSGATQLLVRESLTTLEITKFYGTKFLLV